MDNEAMVKDVIEVLRRYANGFAAVSLRWLFCVLLPFCFSSKAVGEISNLKLSIEVRVDGNVTFAGNPSKGNFCAGENREVVLWVGWVLEPGVGAPTVSWTANNIPVDASAWNQSERSLKAKPTETTKYVGTFRYSYMGMTKEETLEAEVFVYKKPTIQLSDSRFVDKAKVPLCEGVKDLVLKNFDKDNWKVNLDANGAFLFEDGEFKYRGGAGSESGDEIPFEFTVVQKEYEECSATISGSVIVYKSKGISVNLEGMFCANSQPMQESFKTVPDDGIASLYKGENKSPEWKMSIKDAKNRVVSDAGNYKLKTNYSYILPGTTDKKCPSAEVVNEFRVVAVPDAPTWSNASLLSICQPTDASVTLANPSEAGISYVYTLLPGASPKKEWKQGELPVSFSLAEAGMYSVKLELQEVNGCSNLESGQLEVRMQGELVGERIDPEPSVLLCSEKDQALKEEEQKIGFTGIALPGGGQPDGYVYRWVYNTSWLGGELSDVGAARTLTFNKDGNGTGQQGNLKPKAGNNEYVLQYKLTGAADGCWTQLGKGFSVTVTPEIVGNAIAAEGGKGVCNGVSPEIVGAGTVGGGVDGKTFDVQWLKDGTEVKVGSIRETLSVEQAGVYTRRVTSGGCTSLSNGIKIDQYKDPLLVFQLQQNPRCQAADDGEIKVKVTAPVGENVWLSHDKGTSFGATSYVVPAGGIDATITLSQGEYTIVAKTEKGCLSNEITRELTADNIDIVVPNTVITPCRNEEANVHLQWGGGNLRDGGDTYNLTVSEEGGPGAAAEDVGKSRGASRELKKGTYVARVAISTESRCFAEKKFSVQDPKGLDPKTYPALCPGSSDGMIRATLSNVTTARYILEKCESPDECVVEKANATGLFIGLKRGKYRIRALLSDGCMSEPLNVNVGGPEMPKIDFEPKEVTLKCPSEVIDKVTVKITPPIDYDNYIWNIAKKDYVTTKTPALLDVPVGEHALTLVQKEDGCIVGPYTYTIGGPPHFVWKPEPVVNPAKCNKYEGDKVSLGSVVLYGIEGGKAPYKVWWETAPNPADIGQPVQFNTQYPLPVGDWRVKIEDSDGCKESLNVGVGYPVDNSVKFSLRYPREGSSLCYGEQLQGVRIEVSTDSKREISSAWPPIVILERKERGVYLRDTLERAADGTYSSSRGVEPGAELRAIVQAKETDCRSEVKAPVTVYPPISVHYDPLLSDVDVFFHQQVEDKRRSWTGTDGQTARRVLKDSIVAGVLADVPRKVGVEVNYPPLQYGGSVQYSTEPEGLYTQDKDRKNAFEITLSSDAIERYRQAGRVVSARFGRKPLEVLRTTIRVADPTTSCSEDFDLYVRLIRELSIPNVFTPNGDGVNDRWLSSSDPTYQTIFSKLTSLLPNIEVEVFNRAGARVWHAKAEQVAEGWDGTSGGIYGGAELPVGTYYYVIRFNIEGANSWKPISGSVTIVR